MLRDRVLGAVMVVLSLGTAWSARALVADFSYEPVGPRAFPMLLAGLLFLVGAWLAVKGGRPAAEADAAAAEPVLTWSVVVALVGVLAYSLTFQWLGFPIATFLLGIVIGRLFGGTWVQSILTGLGLGIGLFLLFDKLLDVVLPTGLLRTIL